MGSEMQREKKCTLVPIQLLASTFSLSINHTMNMHSLNQRSGQGVAVFKVLRVIPENLLAWEGGSDA